MIFTINMRFLNGFTIDITAKKLFLTIDTSESKTLHDTIPCLMQSLMQIKVGIVGIVDMWNVELIL